MFKSTHEIKLGFYLSKKDFILRNEGSFLGVIWYLLNPIIFFITIYFIRDSIYPGSDTENYPLYLFTGIIIYNLFVQSLSSAILFSNRRSKFLKSINISSGVLLFSDVLKFIYSHLFEIILIILMLIFTGLPVYTILFYPLILFFYFLFILGLSCIFSVLGMYFDDLINVWKAFSFIIFLGTPIFYHLKTDSLHFLINHFNPLFYFIELSRYSFIYNSIPPILYIFVTITFSISIFILGLFIFNKFNKKFAEN